MSELKLGWAKADAAKYACTHWHYSKKMPPPPHNMIGVWEDGQFKGVVIFSRGASSNIGKPFGLAQNEVCELTRVALAPHSTPVTRIIKIAIKMLQKRSKGVRMIVSYADPNHGHEGGIYKAGNWVYAGMTSKTFRYRDKKGKEYHSRQVSATGWNTQYGQRRRTPKKADLEVIEEMPKHRFLYPLDDKMREVAESMRQKQSSAATDFQSVEGGAEPTLTHHSSPENRSNRDVN